MALCTWAGAAQAENVARTVSADGVTTNYYETIAAAVAAAHEGETAESPTTIKMLLDTVILNLILL